MSESMEVVQDTREIRAIFVHSDIDDVGLTMAEFRVYGHLARRSGDGTAYPGIDSIADTCRMNKQTAINAIRGLESRGMIRIERRTGKNNRYILTRRSAWKTVTTPNEVTVVDQYSLGNAPHPNEVTHPPQNRERKVLHLNRSTKVIQLPESPKAIQEAIRKASFAEFKTGWMQGYQTAFGRPYKFQGAKDGTAIKRILGSIPAAEALMIARMAWGNPDGFNCKQAAGISGFAGRINEIRHELEHPGKNGRSVGGNNEPDFGGGF